MNENDEFVEIEGRKVPTVKGLRKMGLMTIGGSFVTTKTKVTDSDYKLSSEQVKTIAWNLMKYSSVTYLQRLIDILKTVTDNYEKAITMFTNARDIDINNLKRLNNAIFKSESCKSLILAGNKQEGYKGLRGILDFQEGFRGREGNEYDWEPFGAGNGYERKSKGLFLWIERAINVAFSMTKGGKWIWPSDITEKRIKYRPPATFVYQCLQAIRCLQELAK